MKHIDQQLVILTSPPASGKTFWISQFSAALNYKKILVVSPLRALADECRRNWPTGIDVMTPEEWLGKKGYYEIVIFDEFHLWSYWGNTFRPLMWEVFYEISQFSELLILLTATFSKALQDDVINFKTQFDEIHWIDCGNQCLKFKPSLYIKAPDLEWLKNQIETEKENESVKLIFCQYRDEVLAWEKRLRELGYTVISCIGGEAKYMQDKLRKCSNPDFIVCTTVLSHGVNLPAVKKVYFLYRVNNIDFWIQMVARGDRRGGKYSVFALEAPIGIKWNLGINFLNVWWLGVKNKFSITRFLREMDLSA